MCLWNIDAPNNRVQNYYFSIKGQGKFVDQKVQDRKRSNKCIKTDLEMEPEYIKFWS